MNRLTKKNMIIMGARSSCKTLFDKIYRKLDKLEDLEEQLGCPLEVFFKILKKRNYYFEYNGKVYYNKKCYINTVNLDDGFISVSVSNEELRNKYIFDVKLFFNEHKNTWWLSETKEE